MGILVYPLRIFFRLPEKYQYDFPVFLGKYFRQPETQFNERSEVKA
ncbi:MAG: hypothetical protein IJ143_09525 [Neisseriaceae bacterium]|nr:hypothetical protein [Neisseriaceae bacterium]